jgi:pre-rRNA-processing protein IPI3
LDPGARALYVSADDGALYSVEFFAKNALLGSTAAEDASTVVRMPGPLGIAPADAGHASCLALSHDGTTLLSGHPKGQILKWDLTENKTAPDLLTSLNADVTNLFFDSPLPPKRAIKALNVVKPRQVERNHYAFAAQFASDLGHETRLDRLIRSTGFPAHVLEKAAVEFQHAQEPCSDGASGHELQRQNEELWEIINEQRALQKETLQRYAEAKSGSS